jgi:ribosomal protein S18 acetylase RimI-like enzyme
MKKINIQKKQYLSFICIAIGSLIAYHFFLRSNQAIQEYNNADKPFVANLFEENWYWLSSIPRKETDLDLFLERRKHHESDADTKNLTIKVMHINGQRIGFIAYYMRAFYEGLILFLALDSPWRGKGYSKQLLNHAISDLQKRGASIIRVVTRPENHVAFALYTHAGFRQIAQDTQHIFLEKKL